MSPDRNQVPSEGPGTAWLPEKRVPRLWSSVVTVVVVLGVVAAVGLPVLLDIMWPPSEVVTNALADAAGGSAAAVAGAFAQDASAGALDKTPSGSAFVEPTGARVLGVVKDGHHDAAVDVTYALGEARQTETVGVTRSGWLAPWRIDAAPAVLQVETPWPVKVRVAGVATDSGAVTVAPGAYRVEIDHDLLAATSKTVKVGLAGGYVEMEPQVHDDADEVASKAVNAVVDECAGSKERLGLQSDCPFFESRPQPIKPESTSWEVTKYPDITLKLKDSEFEVVTTGLGLAVVTLGFDERKSVTYACRFNVDGVLGVEGTDVSWSGNPTQNLEGCKKGKGS